MAYCGQRAVKPIGQISDRAKRYRANTPECLPRGRRICEYCGADSDVQVHHRDGNEANTKRSNLAWACRSCNMSIAYKMKQRGIGTRTVQYNPRTGAKTLAQWVTAVLAMKGQNSDIPVDQAVEIVHATSASDRSKFARQIWQKRRRKNPAELLIMANPAELVVMGANPTKKRSRRNPSGEAAAGGMYEQFHGQSPKHTDEYQEPSPRPATLAELGDLIELRVKRTAGWKWGAFDFTGQGIKLAANAKGSQLYCIGGNQKISRGQLTQLGADNSKELIDLGEATYIAYRTRKAHVDNINSTYEHNFGEETNVRPRLMYDCRGPEPRIYFTGGAYRVEAPGIIN